MEKYIALLRGVNVGGKNKIHMPTLKAAFKQAGFSDVSTYINSGNIIFAAGQTDAVALQQQCRQIIFDTFNLDIITAIISGRELAAALKEMPAWWDNDEQSKHNAIFVIQPASTCEIITAIGEIKPEYEKLAHAGPIIFWSAPIKTFSRTR